ncbi:MAG: D-alanyl-D-alanine carboxypeptidase/D-alanyl-D-alanine-endopeptidase [Woeseia sp.]|nr:D-alanyl-D-alanine carboxypeptidase/D-alanyl-D-alanine-endopeptidase [Woeseia sp.]
MTTVRHLNGLRVLAAFCSSILLLATPVNANEELPAEVQAVLAHRNIPDDRVSMQVHNLTQRKTILAFNADVARNPASTMKLLTTLVALDTLGPTFTWNTEVFLLGELRDGMLHGDILLKGYGDPYLVTERLWQLQRQLRALGVNHIDGNLLLDDSWFEQGDYDPGAFDREPLRAYNVAPNALMTNYKVLRYQFTPAGDKVNISHEPPLTNVAIVNRLRVAPGACRGYQRGIRIDADDDNGRFEFSGKFPAGCRKYSMDRAALDHNAYTYGLFKSLWSESGGSITGTYRNARAPTDVEPDLVFESLPLADVITKVNKHSNNVMARQLLLTLAAELRGPPGTEAEGRAIIEDWLQTRGMDFPELKLANGAGLSRDARITARHLTALLSYGFANRYMPEFIASLPLSGMDGTLSKRLDSARLRGMAHMKTGSLDHVSAIGGYTQARSGDRFSVVVLINYTNVHRGIGDEVQEALLNWVQDH